MRAATKHYEQQKAYRTGTPFVFTFGFFDCFIRFLLQQVCLSAPLFPCAQTPQKPALYANVQKGAAPTGNTAYSRRDRRKSDGISNGALQCPNSARSRRKQGEHRQTAGKEIAKHILPPAGIPINVCKPDEQHNTYTEKRDRAQPTL